MLRLGIATIGLLILGAIFHVQPTAAQAEAAAARMSAASPAQAMGPDLEKLLMARGKPALIISFDAKGTFSPFRAEDATVREMDQPVPPDAKDVKAYTVYFYHRNPHCYTFWNGSKWVEVCPRH